MGLLDDAIREHLELKRRRGADPTEVARAEQEALGPVRREPEAAPAPAEHHDEPHASETDAPAPPAEPEDATRIIRPDEREPAHELHPDQEQLPVDEPQDAAPRTRSAPPQPDPRESDIVHQPTTEFRVEDHHDDEPSRPTAQPRHRDDDEPRQADEDEDVLEETPDFLQETPEHDRLWFEQRPPRDFDFDD